MIHLAVAKMVRVMIRPCVYSADSSPPQAVEPLAANSPRRIAHPKALEATNQETMFLEPFWAAQMLSRPSTIAPRPVHAAADCVIAPPFLAKNFSSAPGKPTMGPRNIAPYAMKMTP